MKKFYQNPYLLFSPFLLFFIIWVLLSPTNGTSGDEARYISYAVNLSHGFYSPPAPNIELINGPGYPLFILPWIVSGLPLTIITVINAFLFYFSIILFYKALQQIFSKTIVYIFSFAWACYYLAYQNIPVIHTETLTYFLISALIWSTLKVFSSDTGKIFNRYVLLSGFLIGYIVLTKMIFGYVLLIMLGGCILLYFVHMHSVKLKRSILILLFGLLTTSPYLVYSYSLTGRMFYWGTGNDALYWMSSLDKNEFGSWFPDDNALTCNNFYDYYMPGAHDSLISMHKADLEEINKYVGIEKDDTYKRLAMRNIRSNPVKYMQNVFYNINRMIFQYPFTFGIHRAKIILVFPINGILLTLILFSLCLSILNWKKILFPIKFLLIFALIYLMGSSLVTAYLRMFVIIVPILLLWIAYVVERTVTVRLRFNSSTEL